MNDSFTVWRFLYMQMTSITLTVILFNFVTQLRQRRRENIVSRGVGSFFIISLLDNNTFSYRELPLFIFLIIIYEFINLKKFNLIYLFTLGFIPILGILWSLDRGIFIIAGYIPFIAILLINRRFIETFIIFSNRIINITI